MTDTMSAYLASASLSRVSLTSYSRDLEKLAAAFPHAETAKAEELQAYFSRLGESLSSSSLSRHLSVVRSYYGYLRKKGIRKDDPMANFHANDFVQKTGEILDARELSRLVSYPSPGFRGMRDRAMLQLLAETGLRVTELTELDRQDLCAGRLRCGKGNRRRELPLSSELLGILEKYLAVAELYATPSDGREPMFITAKGQRLTRQGFWKNLKDRAILCGIDKVISPHTLRRSLALQLMKEGRARREISALLGNGDPCSLRAYQTGKKE